jgi:RNA polymerase sigma factor (sigma-70 family)
MPPSDPADDAQPIDELIDRVLANEDGSWTTLVGRVHPLIMALCRRYAAQDPDLPPDVAAVVVERLHTSHHAALHRYRATCEDYPNTRFERWLATVVAHARIDRARATPGTQRRRIDGKRQLERANEVQAEAIELTADDVDPVSRIELRRILGHLYARDFPPDQRRAVLSWLRGNDARGIADELAIEPLAARALLHAARQRLRRSVKGIP